MPQIAEPTTRTRPTAGDAPIAFTKLPAFIEREYGHRPHLATVHRWRLAGVRGVALNTFLIGARRFVRPSDLHTFMSEINAH